MATFRTVGVFFFYLRMGTFGAHTVNNGLCGADCKPVLVVDMLFHIFEKFATQVYEFSALRAFKMKMAVAGGRRADKLVASARVLVHYEFSYKPLVLAFFKRSVNRCRAYFYSALTHIIHNIGRFYMPVRVFFEKIENCGALFSGIFVLHQS